MAKSQVFSIWKQIEAPYAISVIPHLVFCTHSPHDSLFQWTVAQISHGGNPSLKTQGQNNEMRALRVERYRALRRGCFLYLVQHGVNDQPEVRLRAACGEEADWEIWDRDRAEMVDTIWWQWLLFWPEETASIQGAGGRESHSFFHVPDGKIIHSSSLVETKYNAWNKLQLIKGKYENICRFHSSLTLKMN